MLGLKKGIVHITLKNDIKNDLQNNTQSCKPHKSIDIKKKSY